MGAAGSPRAGHPAGSGRACWHRGGTCRAPAREIRSDQRAQAPRVTFALRRAPNVGAEVTYTDALAVLLADALWRLRDAQDELQAREAAQPSK